MPFQLVSSPNNFQPPDSGGGDSTVPIISKDGRYVLFASTANNLTLNGSNLFLPQFPPRQNVFLRDRTNGTTVLVSVNQAESGGADGDSIPVDISTNGRYVLFESTASSLVSGVSNFINNIFIRDLVAGTNLLVSVSTNGFGGNKNSHSSVMTPDGRYVAFASAATNLINGDNNGLEDIFVRDMQTGTTTLASPGAKGSSPVVTQLGSDFPDITPNGRYVAYYSTATGLVSGVSTAGEIYVRDLVAGTTTWASTYAHTARQSRFGATNGVSFNHIISADGLYVAYQTAKSEGPGSISVVLRYRMASGITDVIATNASGGQLGLETNYHSLDMSPDGRFIGFVANSGTATTSWINVWDAFNGGTTLASGDWINNTIPTNTLCDSPMIDPTGRFVTFLCNASALVGNSLIAGTHIYSRDLQAGAPQLVDVDIAGNGALPSSFFYPVTSTNGQLIAFQAQDGNLAANDNNQAFDVFVRDLANQSTELISARRPEFPASTSSGRCTLSMMSVSSNAQFIAFSSEATNLTSNDTNTFRDIFVRDVLGGTTTLMSVDVNGLYSGNGFSTDPSISADGRYVAFTSSASNLVSMDNNKFQDVFVRDLFGSTMLVSINTGQTASGTAGSYGATISADGRYVLFHSKANNLATGVSSTLYENLYWRDLQNGLTRTFTTNTSTGAVAGAMSPDGRFVLVAAPAQPLYIWDTTLNKRIYTNTTTGAATVVNISPDGTRIAYLVPGTAGHVYAADRIAKTNITLSLAHSAFNYGLCFSADSRFLTYTAADAANTNQVYLYDFQQATTNLVSRKLNASTGATGHSDSPAISPDGRFVAFRSVATNLVAGVSNDIPQIYVFDRLNNTIMLLTTSVYSGASADGRSLTPVFSADGQTLLFESWANDIIVSDFNQWGDVFALGLSSIALPPPFSAGILSNDATQPPTILWSIYSGKDYQVQFKDQLSDPNWQILNATISTNGNQATATDPAPSANHRFYRVVSF